MYKSKVFFQRNKSCFDLDSALSTQHLIIIG